MSGNNRDEQREQEEREQQEQMRQQQERSSLPREQQFGDDNASVTAPVIINR